jgi:hypothetical protein
MTAPAELVKRARKVGREIAFLAAKDVSQKSAPPVAKIVAKPAASSAESAAGGTGGEEAINASPGETP